MNFRLEGARCAEAPWSRSPIYILLKSSGDSDTPSLKRCELASCASFENCLKSVRLYLLGGLAQAG